MTTTTELDQALGLVEDADQILDIAETYTSAVRELVERINAGRIDRDARTDLGGDLITLAEALTAYAVQVLG